MSGYTQAAGTHTWKHTFLLSTPTRRDHSDLPIPTNWWILTAALHFQRVCTIRYTRSSAGIEGLLWLWRIQSFRFGFSRKSASSLVGSLARLLRQICGCCVVLANAVSVLSLGLPENFLANLGEIPSNWPPRWPNATLWLLISSFIQRAN